MHNVVSVCNALTMTNTTAETSPRVKTCGACGTRFQIWHPCSDILDAIVSGDMKKGSITYNLSA